MVSFKKHSNYCLFLLALTCHLFFGRCNIFQVRSHRVSRHRGVRCGILWPRFEPLFLKAEYFQLPIFTNKRGRFHREGSYLIKKMLFSVAAKLKGLSKAVREIAYGLMLHEMDLEMKKEKGHLDNLFMLVVFGDLIGLPVLTPYYSMRLLPHIVPSLQRWKRRLLREKDLTDFVAGDL